MLWALLAWVLLWVPQHAELAPGTQAFLPVPGKRAFWLVPDKSVGFHHWKDPPGVLRELLAQALLL